MKRSPRKVASNGFISLIIALFLVIPLIPVVGYPGEPKTGTDVLKTMPLPRESVFQGESESSSPFTLNVEDAASQLESALWSAHPYMADVSTVDVEPQVQQDVGITPPRPGDNEEAEIHVRPDSGTVRHIRVRNSKVLKGAISDLAPGSERDSRTTRQFLRENRSLLRLDDPDAELALVRHEKDQLSRAHLRYSQKFRGISVWPAELMVHLDPEGNVDSVDGAYVQTPRRIPSEAALTVEEAVEIARREVPEAASGIVSESELIVFANGKKPPRLAWKLLLHVSLEANWLVVVDASNGNLLESYNRVADAGVSGSGKDLKGVTRSLRVWQDGVFYELRDTSKSMFSANDSTMSKGNILVYDMNHSWTGGALIKSSSRTSGWLADGVSAAYDLSKVYDYYLVRHNRNSIDGQKLSIRAFVRYGADVENAFWNIDQQVMFFGDARPFAAALDVVGHELTHGVTASTANLQYKDQSGALNEAMSDIFGESVEDYVTGGKADWIVGEDLGKPLRSMKNPSSIEIYAGRYFPSKMSQFIGPDDPFLNNFGNQDNGGVHLNSTIVSHAYWLLAKGMTGAIGVRNAEKIFYRALTTHLLMNSQFIDARLACVASAKELFPSDSTMAIKTEAAFDAVGIYNDNGTPSPPPPTKGAGADSTIFVSWNPNYHSYYLGRRETSLGDSSLGVYLSYSPLSPERPAVTGDGAVAFFVKSNHDACFRYTNTTAAYGKDNCLNLPGKINSVAMSPDGKLYSLVLRDSSGNPTRTVTVVDLSKPSRDPGRTRTLSLVAPALDGAAMNTIQYADSMSFTSDGRFLIYDAYNLITLKDGSKRGAWSINAIDLTSTTDVKNPVTTALVLPYIGLDIRNPALSRTSDDFMTLEAYNSTSGKSEIYTINLLNGKNSLIGTAVLGTDVYAYPGYTGNDAAVVYSSRNPKTGFRSLLKQTVTGRFTPSGSPTLFLYDTSHRLDFDIGVIYRRVAYSKPVPKIAGSPNPLPFGKVRKGSSLTKKAALTNKGRADLRIKAISLTGINKSEFGLVDQTCLGQTLPASGSCDVQVTFRPSTIGNKRGSLIIKSSDPATPSLTISLTGTGTSH